MRCSCGHENAQFAAYCEVCGTDLRAGARAPPPRRSSPAEKRRTLFDVPPEEFRQSPSPGSSSVDFLTVPLRARGGFDPNDPFRRPAPAQQAGSPARTGGRRAKAKTIIERTKEGETAAALRGALLEDGGLGQVHAVRAGRNSLGRAEGCDIVLEDEKVSQQHGFLFIRDEGATFIDTSTNGSLVDGVRVHGDQVEVGHGARLELGGVRLRLLLAPGR